MSSSKKERKQPMAECPYCFKAFYFSKIEGHKTECRMRPGQTTEILEEIAEVPEVPDVPEVPEVKEVKEEKHEEMTTPVHEEKEEEGDDLIYQVTSKELEEYIAEILREKMGVDELPAPSVEKKKPKKITKPEVKAPTWTRSIPAIGTDLVRDIIKGGAIACAPLMFSLVLGKAREFSNGSALLQSTSSTQSTARAVPAHEPFFT